MCMHTCPLAVSELLWHKKLEAQGPAIAHLITKSKQFSQKKRQPEWQNSNKCMCRQQYISMLLWTFGLKEDFVKEEAPPLPIFFAPPWIHPLEYLAETTTRMAAFQVKPFVFEALFESFLPCLGSTPGWIGVDLIKSLNTYAGHENFIPTKFHKHPSSGSVVKADCVFPYIYTH